MRQMKTAWNASHSCLFTQKYKVRMSVNMHCLCCNVSGPPLDSYEDCKFSMCMLMWMVCRHDAIQGTGMKLMLSSHANFIHGKDKTLFHSLACNLVTRGVRE